MGGDGIIRKADWMDENFGLSGFCLDNRFLSQSDIQPVEYKMEI